MLVFRIETSDGEGPYGVDGPSLTLMGVETHPMPECDGIGSVNPNEYFGFSSLEGLLSWFGKDLHILASRYQISLYKVNKRFVKRGRKQLVFRKEFATLVDTMSC